MGMNIKPVEFANRAAALDGRETAARSLTQARQRFPGKEVAKQNDTLVPQPCPQLLT
jgi:hypothetical protein